MFFYGSLRDAELLSVVLGRPISADTLTPAVAEGEAVVTLATETYPILVPRPGGQAPGVLFTPRSQRDLDRLAFFEDHEFTLAGITVRAGGRDIAARVFRDTGAIPETGAAWDFEAWCARDRAEAIEAGRELMAFFETIPMARIDDHWSAIKTRARARARGAAEPAPGVDLRHGLARARDVEILAKTRNWSGYLAVDSLQLRHRRFDGGWSGPVGRVVVSWGDAVTLLPYDPHRDEVLLLEQFRLGPLARQDPRPWCIEVIAGRIDGDEDAETTARREAKEEAELDIGRIERLPGYYATPGLASEHLVGFVGEADLSQAGGLHGVATEAEDIRAFTLGFDAAIEALEAGAINTGPALVPLLWLARHRERLRAEWR